MLSGCQKTIIFSPICNNSYDMYMYIECDVTELVGIITNQD